MSKDFAQAASQWESGGRNIKNKDSSASGKYQFITSTWNDMLQRYKDNPEILGILPITEEHEKYPSLNDNKPHPDDPRGNPDAQEVMMRLLTLENIAALEKAGIEPSDKNLYMAHFMGSDEAIRLMKNVDSGVNARHAFPRAAGANPTVFKPESTLRDVYNRQTASYSGKRDSADRLIRKYFAEDIARLPQDIGEVDFGTNKLLANAAGPVNPQTINTADGKGFALPAAQGSLNYQLPFGAGVNFDDVPTNKLMIDPAAAFRERMTTDPAGANRLTRQTRKMKGDPNLVRSRPVPYE